MINEYSASKRDAQNGTSSAKEMKLKQKTHKKYRKRNEDEDVKRREELGTKERMK